MLNVLDRLTFNEVKSAGPFLDGCNVNLSLQFYLTIFLYIFYNFFSTIRFFSYYNFVINVLFLQIYLVGFAANIRDKLNKIINVSGATRFDEISSAVTHVIVGDENKASTILKTIKSSGLWYDKKIRFHYLYFNS